jgi:hypothetical protein
MVNEIDSSVAEFVHVQSACVGSLPVETPVAGAASNDEISWGAIIEHASMWLAEDGFAPAGDCAKGGAPAPVGAELDPHPATRQDSATAPVTVAATASDADRGLPVMRLPPE